MADSSVFTYNDETGFLNNTGESGTNLLSDFIGGGSGGGGSTDTYIPPANEPVFSDYVVRVTSNEIGASILINGVNTQKTTPQNINISKTELLNGNIEITLSKEGFSTLEKFVVSLTAARESVVIRNSLFNRPLGISTRRPKVQYFVGTTESTKSSTIINGNFIFADFQLSRIKIKPTNSELIDFKVLVGGPTNSVLITKNGQVDLYPKLGSTNYEDVSGTLFSVKSSDTKLYRITEIVVEGEGEAVETLTATEDESLNINLTLNKSYTLKIQTEELPQQLPALDPRISLLNSEARTYNINSNAGIPLVIRKNFDVKVITVIVGENVYEFDSLDEGDVAGITIPHSAFRGLGQYSVKLYPFSLKNYEAQVRPATPPLVVKQNIKNIKTPIVKVTEVAEVIKPKPFITPYQLPKLDFIPTTPTISTTPVVRSTQPIVRGGGTPSRGGGGVTTLTRDFGTGFGVEQVVDRTLGFSENIQ